MAVEVLRYPNKRIDSTTDYFSIKIVEYTPNTKLAGMLGGGQNAKKEGGSGSDTSNSAQPKKSQSIMGMVRENSMFETASSRASKQTPKAHIYLPIPQDISDENSVNWNEGQLTVKDAMAVNLAQGLMTKPGETLGAGKDALGGGMGGISGQEKMAINSFLSGAAANAIGANVSQSELLSRSTGQVLNPNLEMLFGGVNLRSFPFMFSFAPRGISEAQQVRQIIRKFKQSMAAKGTKSSSAPGSGGSGSFFISAPDVFILEYRQGNGKHPFLNTFKPCVLTNMAVVYTNAGTYTTYHDGTPVQLQMTLNFSEMNPIYAEDYDTEAAIGVGF